MPFQVLFHGQNIGLLDSIYGNLPPLVDMNAKKTENRKRNESRLKDSWTCANCMFLVNYKGIGVLIEMID